VCGHSRVPASVQMYRRHYDKYQQRLQFNDIVRVRIHQVPGMRTDFFSKRHSVTRVGQNDFVHDVAKKRYVRLVRTIKQVGKHRFT
jgi:hypothetical protein